MSQMVLKDVKKTYGKKTVIENLNLTLESGKIYGLIGRNGAGKTTLLSMMSNQAPVTEGSVTLDGENIWENRKALDRICFSRELTATKENGLAGYSVKSYLKIASCYYSLWDQSYAENTLAVFGLDPKSKLGKMSKGQLSAVTVVVALASKCEFTFLDEPTSGLDIVAREQFYKLLLEEYTESGRTFVVSTHIIEEAADIMEEVLILNQGKILLKENTQELLNRCAMISGLQEEAEKAVAGLEVCHRELSGRRLTAVVLLKEGQEIRAEYDVTSQPVTLEKLFVAPCREV